MYYTAINQTKFILSFSVPAKIFPYSKIFFSYLKKQTEIAHSKCFGNLSVRIVDC